MDLSDRTKAGLIDQLGGAVMEIGKEFVLRERRKAAQQEQMEAELELAEARAQALNQTDPSEVEADTATPQERSSRPSRSRTRRSDRPNLETDLARRVMEQLEDEDSGRRRRGMREVRDLDQRLADGANRTELKEAMRGYDVITPMVARAR